MYIHIIASRKLRLQICSAVYCLSWLFFFFFFFFLLLLFLIFNIRFPFSDLASFVFSFLHSLCILSFHSFTRLFTLSVCIFYASSLYNFFSLFFLLLSFFFFRLSKIFFFFFVQRLSSREENNSSTRSSSVSRFRRRILFPLVRRGWQFRRMSHCGACKALERRGLRIYAERHARRVQLFRYKFVHFLFHLLHSGELPFPKIVERMRRGRLEITRVLSQTAAGRVTARAHARVISQSPFVQIGMRQCIHHRDPLVRIED